MIRSDHIGLFARSSDDFQTAAVVAQARCGEARWTAMTVSEQAKAIYLELQKIDNARAKALVKARPDRPSKKGGHEPA